MANRRIVALAIVAISAVSMAWLAVPAASAQPAKADADFAGKVIFVQTRSGSAALERAQVKRLGDQAFLVGKLLNDALLSHEAFIGTTVWLPLADVVRIVEFNSVDEMKKATGVAVAALGKRVEVEWGGTWWPAEILQTKGDKSQIHYTGWDASWDEWVTKERIRPAKGVRGPAGEK
jgi:hypothetical protein